MSLVESCIFEDEIEAYPEGTTCFELFNDYDRKLNGRYRVGDEWLDCYFYGKLGLQLFTIQ